MGSARRARATCSGAAASPVAAASRQLSRWIFHAPSHYTTWPELNSYGRSCRVMHKVRVVREYVSLKSIHSHYEKVCRPMLINGVVRCRVPKHEVHAGTCWSGTNRSIQVCLLILLNVGQSNVMSLSRCGTTRRCQQRRWRRGRPGRTGPARRKDRVHGQARLEHPRWTAASGWMRTWSLPTLSRRCDARCV